MVALLDRIIDGAGKWDAGADPASWRRPRVFAQASASAFFTVSCRVITESCPPHIRVNP
jgi:hypothetical protein